MISNKDNAVYTETVTIQGGLTISNSTTSSVTVVEDISGRTILYVLNSENKDDYLGVNGVVSGTIGSQVFTYDSALLSIATDASDEGKWVEANGTNVGVTHREITVDASSTATSLVSTTEIAENDLAILTKSDNSFIEGSFGVTESAIGTVSDVDPFGDSSGIALYEFENNTNDTGGTYNGTATDVAYATGKFEQGGVFNGTSSKVDVGAICDGLNDFTVAFWMKPNTHFDEALIDFGGYNTGGIVVRNHSATTIQIYVANGPSSDFTTPALDDGSWHHITITRSGVNGEMFVDNVSVIIAFLFFLVLKN